MGVASGCPTREACVRRYVPVRSCSISKSSLLASGSLRRTWIKLVNRWHTNLCNVHAMGVAHDGAEGNQDCEGDGLIMDPIYNGATEWSACSKRSLARFVNSYAGDCLRDDSPTIYKPKQYLRFKLIILLLVFFAMGIPLGIPYCIIEINEDWRLPNNVTDNL